MCKFVTLIKVKSKSKSDMMIDALIKFVNWIEHKTVKKTWSIREKKVANKRRLKIFYNASILALCVNLFNMATKKFYHNLYPF